MSTMDRMKQEHVDVLGSFTMSCAVSKWSGGRIWNPLLLEVKQDAG